MRFRLLIGMLVATLGFGFTATAASASTCYYVYLGPNGNEVCTP